MSLESISVVGAGGIGCAVGYALCAAGVRVSLVDADPAKIRYGREHGVRVDNRPAQQASFVNFADWTPTSGEPIVLCTKCYDNAAVLERLSLSSGTEAATIIPIQNGFDRSIEIGKERLEGIASFVSECHPHQTHTRITRGGRLHLGYRGRNPRMEDGGWRKEEAHCAPPSSILYPPSSILHSLARSRHTPFQVVFVPDILPYKYTKLMYNAAISPLAAAAGIDNGQLLRIRKARMLFFALLQENYNILRDAQVRLGKIGPFHPNTVARILSRPAIANALAWAFYPTLRRTYCSMANDLPAGRTEIDYYNRHLIELAGDRPCPLNRQIYNLVKRMEGERLPTGIERLNELSSDE